MMVRNGERGWEGEREGEEVEGLHRVCRYHL